jgi:hypothetical protein
MAEPVNGGPITTTPSTPSSNYDPSERGNLGPWRKLDRSGRANVNTGRTVPGDFPSSGDEWKQV